MLGGGSEWHYLFIYFAGAKDGLGLMNGKQAHFTIELHPSLLFLYMSTLCSVGQVLKAFFILGLELFCKPLFFGKYGVISLWVCAIFVN